MVKPRTAKSANSTTDRLPVVKVELYPVKPEETPTSWKRIASERAVLRNGGAMWMLFNFARQQVSERLRMNRNNREPIVLRKGFRVGSAEGQGI